MKEPNYVPISQSFGVGAVYTNPADQTTFLVPGTHTYVAPSVVPAPSTIIFEDDNDDEQPAIDAAHCNSIGGTIISLLLVMLIVSLMSCMGRADFNFPFLLFGYYVWCIKSKWHPLKVNQVTVGKDLKAITVSDQYKETCSIRYADTFTIRNIQAFTYLLIGVSVIDIFWVAFAAAAWTCWFEHDNGQGSFRCFNHTSHETLLHTYYMRVATLHLSIVNIFLKLVVIGLSWIWVGQQRKAAYDSYYQVRRVYK